MAGVSLGEEKHDLNEVESEETIRIDGHHVFDRFLDAARSRNWNDWQDHHRMQSAFLIAGVRISACS